MFNERFAIQQRMSEIKEERRELQDEYYKLLDRLRDIDKDSAQSEGFTSDYAKLTEELAAAVQAVTKLVPSVPVAQVIESFKQENPTLAENIIKENKPNLTETQERVQKEVRKALVSIEASESILSKIKPKQAEPIVLNILREEGVPLAPSVIYEKLNAKGYETNTAIHEILRRLALDRKIESPTYGFWQAKRLSAAQ